MLRNRNCCKLLYWETKQQPLKVLETGLAASPSNSALSVYIQERVEKADPHKNVFKEGFSNRKRVQSGNSSTVCDLKGG